MGEIRLEKVHKAFGSTVVIPEIDLDIADNEFDVFVGIGAFSHRFFINCASLR